MALCVGFELYLRCWEMMDLSITEENALRARIKELQDYRRHGITSIGDAEKFVRDGATRVRFTPYCCINVLSYMYMTDLCHSSSIIDRMACTQIIFDPVAQQRAMNRHNPSTGPFLYPMWVNTTNTTVRKKTSPGCLIRVVPVSKITGAMHNVDRSSHSGSAQPC